MASNITAKMLAVYTKSKWSVAAIPVIPSDIRSGSAVTENLFDGIVSSVIVGWSRLDVVIADMTVRELVARKANLRP